jgi:hypothetical protein
MAGQIFTVRFFISESNQITESVFVKDFTHRSWIYLNLLSYVLSQYRGEK